MSDVDPFAIPLRKLRGILKKYEKRCIVDTDAEAEYHLNFKPDTPNTKSSFFAGTGVNKQTISFYLMPVFVNAKLRGSLSPLLKKHLSGKCCFRFRKSDVIPYDELAALTERGFAIRRPVRRQSE